MCELECIPHQPVKKITLYAKSAFWQMNLDHTEIHMNQNATIGSWWSHSENFINAWKVSPGIYLSTPPSLERNHAHVDREGSHSWRRPVRKSLLIGSSQSDTFAGQSFIWRNDITSLRRWMSFVRQRPWELLGKGGQRQRKGSKRKTPWKMLSL